MYALILSPVVLTGAAFCWVLGGERERVKAMDVPLPRLGEPVPSAGAKVRRGQAVFNAKGCVFCHGPNGAGGVKNHNSQGGEIPSLTRVAEGYSASELKAKIETGVRDVARQDPDGPSPPLNMPAWKGHVSEEELDAVAAFLFSLMPQGASQDDF